MQNNKKKCLTTSETPDSDLAMQQYFSFYFNYYFNLFITVIPNHTLLIKTLKVSKCVTLRIQTKSNLWLANSRMIKYRCYWMIISENKRQWWFWQNIMLLSNYRGAHHVLWIFTLTLVITYLFAVFRKFIRNKVEYLKLTACSFLTIFWWQFFS